MGKVILTGDRPTGKLHLVVCRLSSQSCETKDDPNNQMFIMIAGDCFNR